MNDVPRRAGRRSVLPHQSLERRRPERHRQIVPAGIGHHVVEHLVAHRNDIVEIAARLEHLIERRVEARFGIILRRGHERLLRAGEPLDLLRLQLRDALVRLLEPQVRADPGDDLRARQRLGDVIHAARLEALHLGRDVVVRRNEQHRRVTRTRPRVERPAHIVTAAIGQPHVQQHQVRLLLAKPRQSARHIESARRAETRARENALNHPVGGDIVIHHENHGQMAQGWHNLVWELVTQLPAHRPVPPTPPPPAGPPPAPDSRSAATPAAKASRGHSPSG